MQKIVDKEIKIEDVFRAMQAGTYTVAAAQQMFNGMWPIGDYKGYACLWDLDLAVKQPLVFAEQQHILGILDGREEDYDLQTVTIPNATAINGTVSEILTVPTGEVWYVVDVRLITPADVGGTPGMNWRCSLWTDRATPAVAAGQSFHLIPLSNTPVGATFDDEFTSLGPLIGGPAPAAPPTNKPVMLRLPGGTVITFTAFNLTAAATGAMACSGRVFGYIGKSLVD